MSRVLFLCVTLGMAALLLPGTPAAAQTTEPIGTIFPDEALAGAPVTMTLALRQGSLIDRVDLLYRSAAEPSFTRVDMMLTGNTASVTLPSRVTVPPYFEYYIILIDRAGRAVSYPPSSGEQDPWTSPPPRLLQMPVRLHDEADVQIAFLSPDPGSVVAPDEVLISLSLLRADSVAVKRATQVFLDGANVTSSVVISGDLLVFVPENAGRSLAPGPHRVNVRLYNRDGNLHRTAQLEFIVRGDVQYAIEGPVTDALETNGSMTWESRHESIGSAATWYHRGGYQVAARRGTWRVVSSGFLSSDESSDRQPQNRFFIGVEHPMLRLGYGDAYPSSFPDIILAGKRVRGLHSAVRLGAVNLDLTLGTTQRAVEGRLINTFSAESLSVELSRDSLATYGQLDATTWGKYTYGTYSRNLFAVRPSFGSGERWQLGFTWLKAKDDLGSIRYGVRPQENVVLGTDFLTRFDNTRIELTGQAAFSAFNSDISSGTISDARLQSLFPNDVENMKKARDLLKGFITANEYLRPLSLKKPSTLAYDVSLGLRYFDNVFRFTYLFRGSDYTSFGQTYLRKDVRGFHVQDRARLIGNEVYLTLGYERLRDNTSATKVATSTYETMLLAASYLAGPSLPSVTAGFSRYANRNPLPVNGADSLSALDDVTNRVFLQSSLDVTWLEHHTVTANISTSRRRDNSVRRLDVENTLVGILIQTRFAIPLETLIDLSMNFNSLPVSGNANARQQLNYTAMLVGARYGIIPDVLTGSMTIGPTVGDLRRTVVDLSAEWFVLRSLSVILQYSYFQNAFVSSDGFASLRTRYDL